MAPNRQDPIPPPRGRLGDFPTRFQDELGRGHGPGEGDALLLALSGGLDSLVLLHLLRFAPGSPPFRIHAAHFDHRMRGDSGEDAAWVRGLCRAWDVPLVLGRAETPPQGEAEARSMRYEFLLGARKEVGARWLLTAHHADDQAETVLFRVLRGTGIHGLSGIPRRRGPGILRPLLPFRRGELEAYAGAVGIRPREDPSNADLSLPRNYLRRVGLPALEARVSPGARKSLVRLARLARENEEAWTSLIPELLEGLVEASDRGVFIVRSTFLAYHPALRARLLREVLHAGGVDLGEAGTRAVLEFTRTGASGRSIPLPGGLRLVREYDRFLLARGSGPDEDRALVLSAPRPGRGEIVLGGRRYGVRWGVEAALEMAWAVSFPREGLDFPLYLRRWAPGDRIRLPYGTKKLKKLFGEAGIAVGERGRIPVLSDASGRVLWVAGVAASDRARPDGVGAPFFIGIGDAQQP